MSRALNKLTTRQVATLKAAGRHADGGGLYLRITTGGARSWVFMSTKGGKRLEVGLGAASAVSLATVRRLAGQMREVLATGGEALGATWGEIDLEAKLWTIPAARMKAGAAHVVPLSRAAVALLKNLRPEECQPDMRVFAVNGAARSNMAMSMLLRRMKRASITTHGFRSTFSDWAGDATNYPRDLVEQALAHATWS
jgi:hypothetical protein